METWGDFEIYTDQLIGKGGWGEVYKGKQVSLNRTVAIKILKEELTRDKDFVRRFHREAECLAKLADEHIIQVYGAGEHRKLYYFAMEYVPGVTLDKFIERDYKFTVDEVVALGIAVGKALQSAWESTEQIIHRDIKPSNILLAFPKRILDSLTKSGGEKQSGKKLDIQQAKIKVMDFGLARIVKSSDEESVSTTGHSVSVQEVAGTEEDTSKLLNKKDARETNITLAGTILGTPKYISPEQGLGKSVDIRSDIYSLGIVLYEMVTGQIPFKGDDVIRLIRQHIYDTPPLPRTLNPQVPLALEAVIMKCIQKKRRYRYKDPSELLEDLNAIRQKQVPLYTDLRTSGQAKKRKKKKSPVKKFLVSLFLLAVIAACSFFVFDFLNNNPSFTKMIKPNINPARSDKPSPENILDDDEVVVTARQTEVIDSIFDYGIRIKCFVKNKTDRWQGRRLRVELDWRGQTYFKEQTIGLRPKGSDTVVIEFYEPTDEGGDFYEYRVLLKK